MTVGHFDDMKIEIIFYMFIYKMIHLEIPSSLHKEKHLDMLKEFSDNGEEIIPMAIQIKEGEGYEDFLTRVQNYSE